MLSREENELLVRTGPETLMGEYFRRYWLPVLLASELPQPDCPPVQVGVLGERLVAFRDSEGRHGLLDELCPHRCASLFLGRNEESGLRCVYHGWKFVWVPIDDENCWNFSVTWLPERPLGPAEIADLESGNSIHAGVDPASFRPLRNRANGYLLDRQ